MRRADGGVRMYGVHVRLTHRKSSAITQRIDPYLPTYPAIYEARYSRLSREKWQFSLIVIFLTMKRAFRARGVSLLLIFVFPWLGSSAGADEAPRRVLMLHAFNFTFPA